MYFKYNLQFLSGMIITYLFGSEHDMQYNLASIPVRLYKCYCQATLDRKVMKMASQHFSLWWNSWDVRESVQMQSNERNPALKPVVKAIHCDRP